MAGVEQGAYLPVQNARVFGVVHDRAYADPHHTHSATSDSSITGESRVPMEIADEFPLSGAWTLPGDSSLREREGRWSSGPRRL
ncbi:hypothetical protein GCM10010187_20200 [Actinomadura coerulea]|nr:hypothetical protein GCM10010187_20200 [Actinomadura coerulea]